ncbi:MAG: hypothetical protein M1829_005549 [Trizodia sp. TS-e1964]|nr:MAG: hypothetical protein M1829_005549 [Trizodia sp. TS-e1964]
MVASRPLMLNLKKRPFSPPGTRHLLWCRHITTSCPLLSSAEPKSRIIHIAGIGSLGKFVAHTLRGIPNPPPVTFIFFTLEPLRAWFRENKTICLITKKVHIERDGFNFELQRRTSKESATLLASENTTLSKNYDDSEYTPTEFASPSSTGQYLESTAWKLDRLVGKIRSNIQEIVLDAFQENTTNNIPINQESNSEKSASPTKQPLSPRDRQSASVIDFIREELKSVGVGSLSIAQEIRKEVEALDGRGNHPIHKKSVNERNAPIPPNDDRTIYQLILCVTSTHVLATLKRLKRRLTSSSTIVFLQKGMGIIEQVNDEIFPDIQSRPNYIIGINSHGFRGYKDDIYLTFEHISQGSIALAVLPRNPTVSLYSSAKPEALVDWSLEKQWSAEVLKYEEKEGDLSAKYIVQTFKRTPAFCATFYTPLDLMQLQLEYLAANGLIQPLGVVFDCINGKLLTHEPIGRIMHLLMAEISLVIRSLPELQGVPNVETRFQAKALTTRALKLAYTTRNIYSPLLQEVRVGRRQLEISHMNNYLIKRGEELGITCALNYMIYQIVQGKRCLAEKEILSSIPLAHYSEP